MSKNGDREGKKIKSYSASSHVSEEKFLEVLHEMSRICGVSEGEDTEGGDNTSQHDNFRFNSNEFLSHLPSPQNMSSKKNTKRKYQRKKSGTNIISNSLVSDSFSSKRSRNNSGVSHSKVEGVCSPSSHTRLDTAVSDIYSVSIQTPRSDPSPEESGGVCDINIPIESVLQESCFLTTGELARGGGDTIPMCMPPSLYPTPSPPLPPPTPPSLREQRRRYQHHLNLSLVKNEWIGSGRDQNRDTNQRVEVESLCLDLLKRYQQALSVHPPINPASCLSGSMKTDPLLVATRLLTLSLTRLRLFLSNLDCMYWLTNEDRFHLYKSNICIIAILKASVGLDLASMPVAYPLPYGEYLAETEALQLLTAHDLYNDLRDTIASIQSLGIGEFPVMLLVMMAAYFRENGGESPATKTTKTNKQQSHSSERITKIQSYYNSKLQLYLSLRYGSTSSFTMLHNIYLTLDKVRSFSSRLKIFLGEVTSVGLQNQFEPVCENLGLMAYLLQCEPMVEF